MNKDRTILVVDDEMNMCLVLRRILEKAGYKVIIAVDGLKALDIVRESRPDVILLDLMMPGMNGREVCRIARDLSPETRIIYFTARIESDLKKLKELRSEADTFISKPASSRTILAGVNSVLSKTG